MRIVRQKSPDRFTVLDNDLLEDTRISFRSLGIVVYLLSRPDGWETNSEQLARERGHEGRDAVRTALREAESAAYLARKKLQDPATGRWSTVMAIVDRPTPENPSSGPRRLENRPSADRTSVSQALSQSTDTKYGPKQSVVALGNQPSSRTPSGREEIPNEALELLGDIDELTAELRVRRQSEGFTTARWSTRAVRRAIAAALAAGYAAEHLVPALLSIAMDPATKTPGRLPHDGPWWEANELARRNAEREDTAFERERADAAARRAAELEDARRRVSCWRCNGTGRTTVDVDGRNFTAVCTHGAQETA